MNNPKISVIIPVYNVEDYIEDTLNSILNQSFIDNLEILMIDDGSTDNSRYIIEKYALDYDNFYAFHKENEGLAMTRNFGMNHANGEYIHFFDSDDVIAFDSYEKLYNLAIKNDSDFVTSKFTKYGRYNSWIDIISKNAFGNLNNDIDSARINEMPELLWDSLVWNKLFKREFLEKYEIRFPDKNILYEDIPVSLKSYLLADKISVYHDIFYYWRVRRSKNLSITQKRANIKNFNDRIEIINICREILYKLSPNEELLNLLYSKWLNHDIFLFLKMFNLFSDEYSNGMLSQINEILGIIPNEIKDNLNSYKKILYKMVENNDVDSLNYFSQLNNDLKTNPHIPSNLDENYVKYINFIQDALNEDLIIKKEGLVEYDDKNLYINFIESINYLDNDYPHKIKAFLIDSNDVEYLLETDGNTIILPINLIKDNEYMNIKMVYSAEDFEKESFLKNHKRQIIHYDNFDVEVGAGSNNLFVVSNRLKNNNEIKIKNVTFANDLLTFEGVSFEKLNEVYLENVVTFEKVFYSVDCKKENNIFLISFSIPHNDILKDPIAKWEIRFNHLFKLIVLPRRFEFYNSFNKIRIINARNKILIENDLYNNLEKLDEYTNEIYNLKNIKNDLIKENKRLVKENNGLIKKNNNLKRENNKLIDLIDAYKARIVVRFSDKLKNLIN